MPTNDKRINIYPKRLFSLTGISTNFFAFLNDEIDEIVAAIFQGTAGVLDTDTIGLNASGADQFDLDLTNAHNVVVGTGQIIDMSQITGASITADIQFENTNTVTYYVGVKFAEVEYGIELNPRTGDPEYPSYKQTYGEVANPTSLTDTFGSNLRVNINSITESGVDHTGRTVRVWLVDPVSGVESTAYFEGTSAYSAPNNYVDIPYSGASGPLGQDTSVDPPSTTAADYKVFIEGVTWRRNTDLSLDSNYAYLGTVQGAGAGNPPTVLSTSGQQSIFINTLDRAYDGAAGSGSGRQITVDAGAVELITTANTDEHKATLRVNRKGDTDDGGIAVQVIGADNEGAGIVSFQPMTHTAGSMLVDNAADTVNPDQVTRTGAVNWVTSNVKPYIDFAWLHGFSAAIDGLYAITTVTATVLTLRNLTNPSTAPSFTGSVSGNVTILRPKLSTGTVDFAQLFTIIGKGGAVFAGDNVSPGQPAAQFYGCENNDAEFIDTTDSTLPAVTVVTNGGILTAYKDLNVTPNPTYSPNGLQLVGTSLDILDPPNAFLGRVVDPDSKILNVFEVNGRIARPRRIGDVMMYRNWTGKATNVPERYAINATANGDAYCGLVANGCANLLAGSGGAAESATLKGPYGFVVDSAKAMWRFFCRAAANGNALTTRIDNFGIRDPGGSATIAFIRDNAGRGDQNLYLVAHDGTNGPWYTDLGITWAASTFKNFYFAVTSHTTIKVWVEGMSAPLTMTLTSPAGTFSGASGTFEFFAYTYNGAASDVFLYLQSWEIHDDDVLSGNNGNVYY